MVRVLYWPSNYNSQYGKLCQYSWVVLLVLLHVYHFWQSECSIPGLSNLFLGNRWVNSTEVVSSLEPRKLIQILIGLFMSDGIDVDALFEAAVLFPKACLAVTWFWGILMFDFCLAFFVSAGIDPVDRMVDPEKRYYVLSLPSAPLSPAYMFLESLCLTHISPLIFLWNLAIRSKGRFGTIRQCPLPLIGKSSILFSLKIAYWDYYTVVRQQPTYPTIDPHENLSLA